MKRNRYQKNILLAFILVLLLSTFFGSCLRPLLAENPETKIYVDPPISTASLGETFNITINIKHAENVYSWQFKLSWDPTILEIQTVQEDVQEGFFLNQRIHTTIFQRYVDNDAGNLTLVCVLQGEPRESSANGDGTLATITSTLKMTDILNYTFTTPSYLTMTY